MFGLIGSIASSLFSAAQPAAQALQVAQKAIAPQNPLIELMSQVGGGVKW